jgi:hypothetical protein
LRFEPGSNEPDPPFDFYGVEAMYVPFLGRIVTDGPNHGKNFGSSKDLHRRHPLDGDVMAWWPI